MRISCEICRIACSPYVGSITKYHRAVSAKPFLMTVSDISSMTFPAFTAGPRVDRCGQHVQKPFCMRKISVRQVTYPKDPSLIETVPLITYDADKSRTFGYIATLRNRYLNTVSAFSPSKEEAVERAPRSLKPRKYSFHANRSSRPRLNVNSLFDGYQSKCHAELAQITCNATSIDYES
jgi:hypothetical protein